ncbi:DNA methylase N-4/N-6 domain-containing protein [Salinisphaera hydrothermalis C27AD]
MLQYLVQDGMASAGFEVRGAIIRAYRGFRGGDRPKLAEKEFADVCVTPRGCYEPWMIFRRPISEKTVAANLRRWGAGGLRRISESQPFFDLIESARTPKEEKRIADHPTLKPQKLLRALAFALLPTGEGNVVEPFAGSGSTLAACEAIGVNSSGVELDQENYSRIAQNVEALSQLYPAWTDELLGNQAAFRDLFDGTGG